MKFIVYTAFVISCLTFKVFAQKTTDSSVKNKENTGRSLNINEFTKLDIEAEFIGGTIAWYKFLEKNLNTKLANKYLTIPKGETFVKQKVVAGFTVDKDGEITDITITNADDVHEALAKEVLRVMKISPKWKPGYQNGKAVKCRKIQSIWFAVNND